MIIVQKYFSSKIALSKFILKYSDKQFSILFLESFNLVKSDVSPLTISFLIDRYSSKEDSNLSTGKLDISYKY